MTERDVNQYLNKPKRMPERVYITPSGRDPLVTEYETDMRTQIANCDDEARLIRLKWKLKAYLLSRDGGTIDEIVFLMGMRKEKVEAEFEYELKRGLIDRNFQLRKAQMKSALEGATTMQSFLDKKLFGEAESKELTIHIKDVP
jgi:hypothetical protein